MGHDDAFLEDIREHPDDDAPRLVYADWLDEHGQPDRAEFIRLQYRRERLSRTNPQRHALLRRERELLRAYGAQWLGPLCEVAPVKRWQFRRGFPDRLDLTRATYAVAPGPSLAQALAASPHLATVRELDLHGNNVGDEGARALAASPHLGALRVLVLSFNLINVEGVRALAASVLLAGLQELNLRYNYGIADEGACVLVASPHLVGLRKLRLECCGIGQAGAAALHETFGGRVHL
jgi:uncharacterized protein (TIGR02996 family)